MTVPGPGPALSDSGPAPVRLTRKQRNDADPGGLIIIDKPGGMSSHDVVAKVRRIVDSRKVGHGGTLDPMATGVLVVAVNRSTRLLAHLQLNTKVYRATVRLGERTTTDDADGDLVSRASAAGVTESGIRAVMSTLVGEIQQVPASVSAIKVDGERAYKLARAGVEVALAARPVTIERFELLAARRPDPDRYDLEVEVACSSGTYVRALARDLGEALGVGAHLTALRRTQVGPFGLDRARTLEQLATLPDAVELKLPDAIRAAFPVREISLAQADALSYGQFLPPDGRFVDDEGRPQLYGAIDETGRAVALLRDDARYARPALVFIGRG